MSEESRNVTDDLLKLAELKEKGLLSQEEFETAKAALLRAVSPVGPEHGSGKDLSDTTACPHCDLQLPIPPGALGDEIKCPKCRTLFNAELGRGTRIVCEKCSGTGKCQKCNGKGEIKKKETSIFHRNYGEKPEKVECPKCSGDGDCPKCYGKGWK